MSVAINTVTIGGVDDRRLELRNSQAARVIDIGTNWTKIRLALRFALSDLGANITGTPRLYLGMLASPSAGMANGPLTATTSHFVGYINPNGTWSRSAGPPVSYGPILNTGAPAKKIGATITTGAGFFNQGYVSGDAATARDILILDITKGAPNFKFDCAFSQGAIRDLVLAANLEAAMQSATCIAASTFLNSVMPGADHSSMGDAGTLAVSEATDGFLNAVCVAWDRSNPVMHISDFYWAKMA